MADRLSVLGKKREREARMERGEIAENECETDRRLCTEAADGLGSSRARRRNAAFVLPAVCLSVSVFSSVCMSAELSVSLLVNILKLVETRLLSERLFVTSVLLCQLLEFNQAITSGLVSPPLPVYTAFL